MRSLYSVVPQQCGLSIVRSLYSAGCPLQYNVCEIVWHRWDVASVAVCGVVLVAAMYSAGIVAWSIHTGTVEGPLLHPTLLRFYYE